MAARNELEILLRAKADIDKAFGDTIKGIRSIDAETKKAAESTAKSFKSMDDAFKALGITLTSGAIIEGFDMVLKAQAESEAAINKLNLALANQGRYNQQVSASLIEYAAAQQLVSTFDHDAILRGEALLASFGMTEAQIKRATKAAMDYAAATGTDLESAIQLVGKAFSGHITALQKQGFVFGANMTAVEKYDAAMLQLEERFGGQALVATENYTGQLKQIQNAFHDTEEQAGKFAGSLLDLGGAGGGTKAALGWLGDFFGKTLVIALSEARALTLEFFAGIASDMAKIGQLAGEHPIITRLLGGDPAEIAHQGEVMKFFADGLRRQAEQIREEADRTAAAYGTLATVHNASMVAMSAQERAMHEEALKEAEKEAAAQKALAEEIFRFRIATSKEELKLSHEFWKEQYHLADDYGKMLLYAIKQEEEEEDRQEKLREDYDKLRKAQYEKHIADLRALGTGLANLGQALGGFFGGVLTLGSGAVQAFANLGDKTVQARNEMQKMAVALDAAAQAYQSGNWEQGAAQGAAAGAQWGIWGAVIGAVAGALLGASGAQKKLNEALKQAKVEGDKFFLTMGGLDVLKLKAEESGISLKAMFDATTAAQYTKALKEVEAEFSTLDEANKGLDEAMKKWGITIEQLGPKFRQQKMDEQALDILKDFDLLNAAGVDWLTLMDKFGPSINDYVNRAVAAGTTIPEAWKPILQKMIDNHELLDANGKAYTDLQSTGVTFATTVTGAIKDLISKITDLVNALLGIPNIHRTVTIDTITTPGTPGSTGPGNNGGHGGNGGGYGGGGSANGNIILPFVRRFASGGVVQPRPGGVSLPGLGIVAEAGQAELVAPVKAFAREVAAAALAQGGGGAPTVIQLILDNRVLDEVIVKRQGAGFYRR